MSHFFKRLCGVFLLPAVFLSGSILPWSAQAVTLRVGVYTLKPDIFLLPNGRISGIMGEVLNEIAKREGWIIQPKACDWPTCLHMLETGAIDLMPDVIYTPDRAKIIDFGKVPVLESWTQVYAPKQRPLHTIKDLQGLTLAVLAHSAQYGYLKQVLPNLGINIHMLPVADMAKGFQLVQAGKADAVVSDYLAGQITGPQYHLVAMPIVFMATRIFFATPKNRNAAILSTIDSHLKDWKADPHSVYYQILSHWESPDSWAHRPWYFRWLMISLAVLLLVLLGVFVRGKRQQHQHGKRLRTSETRLNAILRSVDAMIYVKDREQRYLYANNKVSEFFGLDANDLLMRRNRDLLADADTIETIERTDQQALRTGYRVSVQERLVSGVTGKEHTFLSIKVPLLTPEGFVEGVCAILTDITDRVQAEEQVHRLAFYDILTDLPNRRMSILRLGNILHSVESEGVFGAVLNVDLDGFKKINDARGRRAGDLVLQEVAKRLVACTRERDTVSRISGDEYMLVLTRLGRNVNACARRAMKIAEKLRAALTQDPMEIEGKRCVLSVSIGMTLVQDHHKSVDDIIREADMAMMQAKQDGRNRTVLYGHGIQAEIRKHLELEHDLMLALGTDQLQMHLQPQFSRNNQVTGAELLMRWTHPTHGAISPAVFIPIAEEANLIDHLTDWSLQEACSVLLELKRLGKTYSVSLNLSPKRLAVPGFSRFVRDILVRTGAPGERLIFEVTENLWIQDIGAATQCMGELSKLGIRFSIDDFGTGYSNLAYLKRLAVYELKIDQSLVQGLPQDVDSLAIVELILAMAKQLGKKVVAEGVETEHQAEWLFKYDFVALQGYLMARPMPISVWIDRERQDESIEMPRVQ